MGILKLTIDVLDYFSTGIVISILFNVLYSIVVDYMVSGYEEPWSFIVNYSPDMKSLKFYRMVLEMIYKYLFNK
jgi:hypothetical protein